MSPGTFALSLPFAAHQARQEQGVAALDAVAVRLKGPSPTVWMHDRSFAAVRDAIMKISTRPSAFASGWVTATVVLAGGFAGK